MRPTSRTILTLTSLALLGASAACSDSSNDPPTPVPAPSGVAVSSTSGTSATITWSSVAGATGYTVERAAGTSGGFAAVATNISGTSYTDTGLSQNTAYQYRVYALDGARTSVASTAASVTTGENKVVLTGNITQSMTLTKAANYVLSGYVKVQGGATLTIQPGTRIVGDTTVAGSSLWILRGAKIDAQGTAQEPIVFTSQRSAGNRKPGDWGGIIIIGNAPINRTANPIFTEGPSAVSENYAGGTSRADNSGTLQYVRVEFAGYDVSNGGGQELNSISSYAVGSGTHYDYVESLAGLDDSFEFFGGAPDIRHMVSYESGDDHFDWTEGFQGRGQFLIAMQSTLLQPRAGAGTLSSDPRGFEGDGCENDKAGCTYANQPYSMPVWANFTVIGPGTGVFATTDGNGAVVRRGSGATLVNGVIGRWPGTALDIRDAESGTLLDADSITVRNLVLAENGANFDAAGQSGRFAQQSKFAGKGLVEYAGSAASLFTALPATPTSAASLDWTPSAGSPLTTAGLNTFAGTVIAGRVNGYFGGAMAATAYAGAADPAAATGWWTGWTSYARN